jgi:hypothetical protein
MYLFGLTEFTGSSLNDADCIFLLSVNVDLARSLVYVYTVHILTDLAVSCGILIRIAVNPIG